MQNYDYLYLGIVLHPLITKNVRNLSAKLCLTQKMIKKHIKHYPQLKLVLALISIFTKEHMAGKTIVKCRFGKRGKCFFALV